MPYRSLTLEEFARHIDLDVREVRRLAERGRLPGEKVGGQWRFNEAEVTEWLDQEMSGLGEERLAAIERAMGRDGTGDFSPTFVTDLIGLGRINAWLPARTKGSVLLELVELADRTGIVYDEKGLLQAVREREELGSTALPDGVAIPHPRRPSPNYSAEPFICVGRVPGGIGFGEAKGRLTTLFLLICSHDHREHLRVLARLARMLGGETIEQLMEAETAEGLLKVLIERERAVALSGP